MSLLTSDNMTNVTAQYQFSLCFSFCKVIDASNLIFPSELKGNYRFYLMFMSCTTLVKAPKILPATTLTTLCYYRMFDGCTNLETAPILPATKRASGNTRFYEQMFYNCKKLNHVEMMMTEDPSEVNYTKNWLYNVSSTGTFVKNANATWDLTGASGIPDGWEVESKEP